jgi:hypothetical protein
MGTLRDHILLNFLNQPEAQRYLCAFSAFVNPKPDPVTRQPPIVRRLYFAESAVPLVHPIDRQIGGFLGRHSKV